MDSSERGDGPKVQKGRGFTERKSGTWRDAQIGQQRQKPAEEEGEHNHQPQRERQSKHGRSRSRSRSRSPKKAKSRSRSRSRSRRKRRDRKRSSSRDRRRSYSRDRRRSRSRDRRRSHSASPRKEKKRSRKWDDAPPDGATSDPAAPALSSAQLSVYLQAQQAQLQVQKQQTRQSRRLYVGGILPETNQTDLINFFYAQLVAHGMVSPASNPVIGVEMNSEKAYAFVEFATAEDASAAMTLDNAVLNGKPLRVRRPRDYVTDPTTAVTPALLGMALDMNVAPAAQAAAAAAVSLMAQAKPGQGGAPVSLVPETTPKLYISGLPPTMSVEHLREILTVFGTIKSLALPTDPNTGIARGYAFAQFSTEDETKACTMSLTGRILGDAGRPVQVRPAASQTARTLSSTTIPLAAPAPMATALSQAFPWGTGAGMPAMTVPAISAAPPPTTTAVVGTGTPTAGAISDWQIQHQLKALDAAVPLTGVAAGIFDGSLEQRVSALLDFNIPIATILAAIDNAENTASASGAGSGVACVSSTVIILNAIAEEMASDEVALAELKQDMTEIASQFGDVRSITIPGARKPQLDEKGINPKSHTQPLVHGQGMVFVEFANTTGAKAAAVGLAGRRRGGRTMITSFLPPEYAETEAEPDMSFGLPPELSAKLEIKERSPKKSSAGKNENNIKFEGLTTFTKRKRSPSPSDEFSDVHHSGGGGGVRKREQSPPDTSSKGGRSKKPLSPDRASPRDSRDQRGDKEFSRHVERERGGGGRDNDWRDNARGGGGGGGASSSGGTVRAGYREREERESSWDRHQSSQRGTSGRDRRSNSPGRDVNTARDARDRGGTVGSGDDRSSRQPAARPVDSKSTSASGSNRAVPSSDRRAPLSVPSTMESDRDVPYQRGKKERAHTPLPWERQTGRESTPPPPEKDDDASSIGSDMDISALLA